MNENLFIFKMKPFGREKDHKKRISCKEHKETETRTRTEGGLEGREKFPELPLDGQCSLCGPMKGVIVCRLPRARKVSPAAGSGPSICQDGRGETQGRLCQILHRGRRLAVVGAAEGVKCKKKKRF